MPVKRRKAKVKNKITPAALELFRQLKAAETHEQWWTTHAVLHKELGCKPWEWPCVEDPDWQDDEAHPDALALWADLEAANDQATLGRVVQAGPLET